VTTLLAPAPNLPRVGIVDVNLPTDGYAIRTTWIQPGLLIVGYDSSRVTRSIVDLWLDLTLGAYVDIDAEEARR
jgi:hypothetical protein